MNTTHATRSAIRRHRRIVIALGAAAVIATAGGIATAAGGSDAPSPIPAAVQTSPAPTCLELAQMGAPGNAQLSAAALESWKQLWTDAHC